MAQAQNPKNQPNRQIRMEIPKDLKGVYSNAAMISQTHSEIVIDFSQMLPNDPRARVQARIVMTPPNAKAFLQALQTNLDNFEKTHGEIVPPPKPQTLADHLFKSVKPEDEDEDNEEDES